mmetsp:Transcript_8003/g.24904  ORF Transcript_8003/g.24904 Transcript_8003/m.24904 type:complete len:201 (-) Transcript_8003:433-1035(-)
MLTASAAGLLDEDEEEAAEVPPLTLASLMLPAHWALAVVTLDADVEEAVTLLTFPSSSSRPSVSSLSWSRSFPMASAILPRTEGFASNSIKVSASQGHSPQALQREQRSHPVTVRSALQQSHQCSAKRSSHSNSTVSWDAAKCTRFGAVPDGAAAAGDGVIGVESEQPCAIGSLQRYLGGHGQGAGDSGHRSGAAAARTS